MGPYRSAKGLLNNSKILECQSHLTNSMNHHKQGACPKRPVQQGRRTPGLQSQRPLRQSRLGDRSVYGVREDDKDPRTPLADFFNRPVKYLGWLLCFGAVGFPLLAPIPARSGHVQSALDEWHILPVRTSMAGASHLRPQTPPISGPPSTGRGSQGFGYRG